MVRPMRLDDITSIATGHSGVREAVVDGLRQWRFTGGSSRELAASHVGIRAEFDARDILVERHPEPSAFQPDLQCT